MKNIHVLKTDKPSRLLKDLVDETYQFKKKVSYGNRFELPLNIYITSDEEIKFNDYITDGYKVWQWKDDSSLLGRKKIILTTDQDLIKNGVQAIDDEFLEWFVKNPSCEWVDVWLMNKGYNKQEDYPYQEHYLIIIPKEETKKKHKVIIVGDGLPKQETLEEELLQQIKFCLISKNDSQAIRLLEKYAFEKQLQSYNDLKLQQEQIYNQIKQLHDNENITGFSKRAYAQCLDIVEHFKKNNKWK